MCGIVGFLDKSGDNTASLGRIMMALLEGLACRGPDSAGVALFGPRLHWHARIALPASYDLDAGLAALHRLELAPFHHYKTNVHDVLLRSSQDAVQLEERILTEIPGAEVLCLGRQMNLFKQVGSPASLQATYAVDGFAGTHGIGHTRLSTESRVDLSHSQPFWAHGVADLATVHNGHITNYHKLRRRFEREGRRFFTENDSELIGVYLRDRLETGQTLAEALQQSQVDFDGSYSYLVASAEGLALVRDRFGFKPLLVAETEQFVALATEETALRQALGTDFDAREAEPGVVQLWPIPTHRSTNLLAGAHA